MKKFFDFSNQIISFSRGWMVILSLFVFLIFTGTVLPNQAAKADLYSGEVGSPDLSLFYSQDDLYSMAEKYGPVGRQSYILARFTFDLAFPFVYGAFLLTTIAWLLGKFTDEESFLRLFVYMPIFAVAFDFLENAAASFVIGRYPAQSPIAAVLAPGFTFVKWIFVGGSFALVLILPILSLRKKRLK